MWRDLSRHFIDADKDSKRQLFNTLQTVNMKYIILSDTETHIRIQGIWTKVISTSISAIARHSAAYKETIEKCHITKTFKTTDTINH